MINKNDRIAFSLKIVSATETIDGLTRAQQSLLEPLQKAQNLDNANKNLFDPTNTLINGYQNEIEQIDGGQRFEITEQDIQDSANRVLQNHFYPNDINTSVPSLAPGNVWIKTAPFARTYAIGKNYQEANTLIANNEDDVIDSIQALIASAGSFSESDLTTGGDPIPNPAIHTLKDNLVIEVNKLIAILNIELASIVTNDPNTTNQANNNAALNYINNNTLPALNLWISYPDFGVSPPTKLSSAQRSALLTAVNSRETFLITRKSQISTILGSITQDLSTGLITASSGFYGTRYTYLDLRLNLFSGSAIEVANILNSINAQNGIKSALAAQKDVYMSILPTSVFKASGNNTDKISVINPTLFSVGDEVYIYAEEQEELRRAIKAISNDMITLNDIVPAKYRPIDKARIYKDLT